MHIVCVGQALGGLKTRPLWTHTNNTPPHTHTHKQHPCTHNNKQQGRFKREIDAGAICLGQEFVKPGSVPPFIGEIVLTAASKVFSSSAHVDVHTALPYFMNPVLAACQVRRARACVSCSLARARLWAACALASCCACRRALVASKSFLAASSRRNKQPPQQQRCRHRQPPPFMIQTVNVAEPGQEPQDLWAAKEDMRLFAPELADKHGNALPAERRRRWCDAPRNLEGRAFSPDHVYTLHIWQHLIDFSSYKLSVGGFVNLDLAAALNAQPLQLTCKDIRVRALFVCVLAWLAGWLAGSMSGWWPSVLSAAQSRPALAQSHPRPRPPQPHNNKRPSNHNKPQQNTQSGEYVFSMLVWHERLLYDDETSAHAAHLSQRFASVGNGLRGLLGFGNKAA